MPGMRTFVRTLPTLLPDELIPSMCARLIDRLRVDGLAVFRTLFGVPYPVISWDLPRHLDHLGRILPSHYELDYYDLLEQHTLFPFFRIFTPSVMLPTFEVTSHRSDLLRPDQAARHVPTVLRYCPSCADNDRLLHGERYWHRSHQLPGVYVCVRHEMFLEPTTIELWCLSGPECEKASAERVLYGGHGRPINPSLTDHLEMLRIARIMVALLNPQTAPTIIKEYGRQRLVHLSIEAYRLNFGDFVPPQRRVIPESFIGQAWTQHLG